SLHVQSEIVVPIRLEEQVIAEIDIDSHQHSPFTQADRIWLERLAAGIAPLIEEYRLRAGADAGTA
ncbi:MAG: GAF domain-containing protein, partial [Spirochaeta sp.]